MKDLFGGMMPQEITPVLHLYIMLNLLFILLRKTMIRAGIQNHCPLLLQHKEYQFSHYNSTLD